MLSESHYLKLVFLKMISKCIYLILYFVSLFLHADELRSGMKSS